MGIKAIDIAIHGGREVFYAGELVSGIVSVEVGPNSEVPCIAIRFYGNAHCHWSETKSSGSGKHRHTHTVSYTANVDLFTMEQTLTTTLGKLMPGMNHLNFAFQLPRDGLVTSMEGYYGYVRYRLDAQEPGSNWVVSLFKPKAHRQIKILQLIDTNVIQYRFPVAAQDTKVNCCFCCASGPLFVEAQSDRAAYCPGEIVTITATFRNTSSSRVRPYAKLVQKRIFRAQGHVRGSVQNWDLIPIGPTDGVTGYLGQGQSSTWNGVQFKLPECLPSISIGIIDQMYHIEVGLDIPWAFDLEVYLPVVIGTIPFRGEAVAAQFQPQPVGAVGAEAVADDQYSAEKPPSGPYNWGGSGKQTGNGTRSLPSAPPLLAPLQHDFSAPPPSYFASVMSAEKATVAPEGGDEKGGQAPPQLPPGALPPGNAAPPFSQQQQMSVLQASQNNYYPAQPQPMVPPQPVTGVMPPYPGAAFPPYPQPQFTGTMPTQPQPQLPPQQQPQQHQPTAPPPPSSEDDGHRF